MDTLGSMTALPLLLLLAPLAYIYHLYRIVTPSLPRTDYPRLLSASSSVSAFDGSPLRDQRRNLHKLHEARISNCEDIAIWHSRRLAILSTDPGRNLYNPFTGKGDLAKAGQGKLQVFNLDTEQLHDLQIQGWPESTSLHPLGVNILENQSAEGDEALLGIANLSRDGSSVEVVRLKFVSSPDGVDVSAKHVYSLMHPDLTSANALVFLSETSVLVTNSFGVAPRTSLALNTIEQSLALPGGSVKLLTYSPTTSSTACKTLISGIPLANGLAMNKAQNVLAVASTTGTYVAIYDVAISEGGSGGMRVKHRNTLPAGRGFLVDNLHFVEGDDANMKKGGADVDEVLLCAGHPSALQYMAVAEASGKAGVTAPSRVVKITIPTVSLRGSRRTIKDLFVEQGEEVQTVFESDGKFFRTSSTAAAYTDKGGKPTMLVCGLWQEGLLKCENVDLAP